MKRALILIFALLAACAGTTEHKRPVPAKEEGIDDWGKLQLAIAMTESEFRPDATGTQGDRGIFQIRAIYVAEVNRLAGTDYTPEDAYDTGKALRMFELMQTAKNPGRDMEAAIRCHNKSGAYRRKVLENLAFVERYEAFREQITRAAEQ